MKSKWETFYNLLTTLFDIERRNAIRGQVWFLFLKKKWEGLWERRPAFNDSNQVASAPSKNKTNLFFCYFLENKVFFSKCRLPKWRLLRSLFWLRFATTRLIEWKVFCRNIRTSCRQTKKRTALKIGFFIELPDMDIPKL